MEISEDLYKMNLKFSFNKKDVESLLSSDGASIYSEEIRNRIKNIIFEQMRRYPYLF